MGAKDLIDEMAILNPDDVTPEKPRIDLSGPDGNAFVLIGLASKYASKLGLDFAQIEADMTAGDYDNLVAVFDQHFGDYIDLVRAQSAETPAEIEYDTKNPVDIEPQGDTSPQN